MNTKTQELVTAGYALAKRLDAESAKLVKELADELAVQRVRADELNKQVVNLAVENAALTSGCGFFAYDPDNGFEEFKTKDEAIEAAESYIDYYRGDACDGWADEVSQVSWGVVIQQSTKVDERPKNAEDSVSEYIETVCDFALLPAIITPTTDAAIASIKVQARIEGAHFVANRMLAAWEAGFIEDTAKNAADIARMILTSTEFVPTAPEGDFDRSFADGVLEDIAAQLRKEAGNA